MTAFEAFYTGLIKQYDDLRKSIKETERREKVLREDIEKHRHDVWGDSAVKHDSDVELYAALTQEARK